MKSSLGKQTTLEQSLVLAIFCSFMLFGNAVARGKNSCHFEPFFSGFPTSWQRTKRFGGGAALIQCSIRDTAAERGNCFRCLGYEPRKCFWDGIPERNHWFTANTQHFSPLMLSTTCAASEIILCLLPKAFVDIFLRNGFCLRTWNLKEWKLAWRTGSQEFETSDFSVEP